MIWNNILQNYPIFTKIFIFIILGTFSLALSIIFKFKDFFITILVFSITVIFLYAYGVLDLFWATMGYIIIAIVIYIIYKNKGMRL